jgi:hypothetical protein
MVDSYMGLVGFFFARPIAYLCKMAPGLKKFANIQKEEGAEVRTHKQNSVYNKPAASCRLLIN